jgi:phage-related protein
MPSGELRPLVWVGSSYKDLLAFPESVRMHMGYALYLAQNGARHRDAKSLQGFGGAGVLEIVSNHDGNTFRAIYTVRFANAVYVLHAFQKKSKSGRETPKTQVALVKRRLHDAEMIVRGNEDG